MNVKCLKYILETVFANGETIVHLSHFASKTVTLWMTSQLAHQYQHQYQHQGSLVTRLSGHLHKNVNKYAIWLISKAVVHNIMTLFIIHNVIHKVIHNNVCHS